MAVTFVSPKIDVYYCIDNLDQIDPNCPIQFLNNRDIQRLDRLIRREDKVTFKWSHAFLNYKLSKLIRTSPEEVTFRHNNYGKPYMQSDEFYFNLTHTRNAWAVALHSEEVGIDIEEINDSFNYEALISRSLSSREQTLMKFRNNAETFFKLWTRKEALTKALGVGLNIDFSSIDVCENKANIKDKSQNINKFNLKSFKLDNFILSVAFPSKSSISMNRISPQNYPHWFE